MKAFFDNGPLKGQSMEVPDATCEWRTVRGASQHRVTTFVNDAYSRIPGPSVMFEEVRYQRTDRQYEGATVFTVGE